MDNGYSIEVMVKTVYGNTTIYPICDKAHRFCDMLRQKTLTLEDIAHIKQLGFEIVVKQEPVTL